VSIFLQAIFVYRNMKSANCNRSITYVIRTEESLQAIYKKLSLDIYLNDKSITYIIRTEESLQAIYKKLSLIVCDYHKLIN